MAHKSVYSVPLSLDRPLLTHASPGNFWTLTDESGSISCGVTAPFSWILVYLRFCLCPPRVWFSSPVEVPQSNLTGLQSQITWGFSVPLLNPQFGKSVLGPRTFAIVPERLGIVVLQFVGYLLSDSLVGRMTTSSMRTCDTCYASQVCGNQSLCIYGRLLWTYASSGDTKTLKSRYGSISCGVPESWCTRGFVCTLQAPLSVWCLV